MVLIHHRIERTHTLNIGRFLGQVDVRVFFFPKQGACAGLRVPPTGE